MYEQADRLLDHEARDVIGQLQRIAEGLRHDATWLLECVNDFERAIGRLHGRNWSETEICQLQVVGQTYRPACQSDVQRAAQDLSSYVADIETI